MSITPQLQENHLLCWQISGVSHYFVIHRQLQSTSAFCVKPLNRIPVIVFLPEGFQLHELVCYSVIPHISRAVLTKIKTISTENRSNKTRICTLVHTGDQSRWRPLLPMGDILIHISLLPVCDVIRAVPQLCIRISSGETCWFLPACF